METEPDEKIHELGGVEYQYSTDWVHQLESEQHWRLYWQQQNLMDGYIAEDDHLLEIGVGTGFTANYLRAKNLTVTTADIDKGKNPGIVTNIVSYDFPDSYDSVLAFEVFEHIPFSEFASLLPRLHGAVKKYFFFSVPRNRKNVFQFSFKLPKLRSYSWCWTTKKTSIAEHHFWELEHGGTTDEKLMTLLEDNGFKVVRKQEAHFRCFFAAECIK